VIIIIFFLIFQTEQVSFLIVLFILIVTGNCTVLTILSMSGKIRSRMNLFMANLACAGKYEVQLLAFELIPGF